MLIPNISLYLSFIITDVIKRHSSGNTIIFTPLNSLVKRFHQVADSLWDPTLWWVSVLYISSEQEQRHSTVQCTGCHSGSVTKATRKPCYTPAAVHSHPYGRHRHAAAPQPSHYHLIFFRDFDLIYLHNTGCVYFILAQEVYYCKESFFLTIIPWERTGM